MTDESRVYVVTKNPAPELAALDHDSGTVQWSRSATALLDGAVDDVGLYGTPLASVNETVFAVVTTRTSNVLVGIDVRSGAVEWRLRAGQVRDVVAEPAGSLLVAERVESRGVGRVRRVGLRSGDVLWTYRTPSDGETESRVHNRVAVDGETVYVPVSFPPSNRGEIHVLDKRSGSRRTTVPLDSRVFRGLVVQGDRLVGAHREHPDCGPALFAVDTNIGRTKWVRPAEWPVSGIAAAGKYVVYEDRSTRVVDAATGDLVRSTDAVVDDAPLVAGSRFPTVSGRTLYSHGVESGELSPVYRFDAPTEVEGAIASKGYLLLVVRQTGVGRAVVALGG